MTHEHVAHERMTHAARLAAILLCGWVPLLAQQTWIVDASSGVGANFTDLPAAVTAAQNGDSIVVRAGDYTGVRVSKPLAILGEPGARILWGGATYAGLIVTGISAGQTFAASGLDIQLVNPLDGSLAANACAGTVLFERLVVQGPTKVLGSADVRLSGCSLQRIVASNSTLSMSESTCVGSPGVFSGRPALRLTDSSATVSRCTLTGSPQAGSIPSTGAITLSNSALLLTGNGTGQVVAGTGTARSAIEGTGTALVDPIVNLVATAGAPLVAASIAVTMRTLPSLRAVGGPPGGAVMIDLYAGVGDAYFTFVGLVAPPVLIPAWGGSVAIQGPLLLSSGMIGASHQTFLQASLPNSPLLIGKLFSIQALTISSTAWTLSNAGTYVHGSV